jgi:hypothetical protein
VALCAKSGNAHFNEVSLFQKLGWCHSHANAGRRSRFPRPKNGYHGFSQLRRQQAMKPQFANKHINAAAVPGS